MHHCSNTNLYGIAKAYYTHSFIDTTYTQSYDCGHSCSVFFNVYESLPDKRVIICIVLLERAYTTVHI